MSATQYPIVTICGSMQFYDAMLDAAQDLTGSGYIVLMPFVKKGEGSTDIAMLDDMHKTKISMSEEVIVICGGTGYIGESTASEIQYAKEHGIRVTYA